MINTKEKLAGPFVSTFCIRGGDRDIIIGMSVFQDLDIDWGRTIVIPFSGTCRQTKYP